MRVAVYPADRGGCGHYRMIWPAEALQRKGYDVTIIEAETERSHIKAILRDHDQKRFVHAPGYLKGTTRVVEQRRTTSEVLGLAERPEFDVIVLQRPLGKNLVQLIPHLQEAGVVVVVELDDDFHRLDPRNQVWRAVQPKDNPDSNIDWLDQAVRLADQITVSTPALADVYARKGRPAPIILPNFLPPHAYWTEGPIGRPALQDQLTVGWSGSVGTHPADLPECAAALRKVSRLSEWGGFYVVGSGVAVGRQTGIEPSTTGWLPLDEYHAALDDIDIGIVPLQMTRFNECKSWLKGLEFAARGIPAVASPTAEYRALQKRGGCLVAETHGQWVERLRLLLTDRVYYRDTASAAWEAARALCIDDHAEAWWYAWTAALAQRRAG